MELSMKKLFIAFCAVTLIVGCVAHKPEPKKTKTPPIPKSVAPVSK